MFITLEGIDGCGKSTQARLLVEKLVQAGWEEDCIVWTKEPGGWQGGEKIRELLLEEGMAHLLGELFLFLADRSEHVHRVIGPALSEGRIVICERYTDSTLAYQAWGRGISTEKIEDLFRWCAYPVPDVTFWIDLPSETAYRRMTRRGSLDQVESEGVAFLDKVRSGFAFLATRECQRIVRIEGKMTVQDIAEEIYRRVEVALSL